MQCSVIYYNSNKLIFNLIQAVKWFVKEYVTYIMHIKTFIEYIDFC